MTKVGFTDLPCLTARIEDVRPTIQRRWIAGLDGRWPMACAAFEAPGGFDVSVKDQREHHTLSFLIEPGACVERMNGPFAGARVTASHFAIQHVGEAHHYRSGDRARFGHLYFRPAYLAQVAETAGRRAPAQAGVRQDRIGVTDDALLSDIRGFLARASSPLIPSLLEMDARALVIALALLERHGAQPFAREVIRGGLAPRQLRRAREAMEARFDGDVGLGELASVAGVSPTHFSRAFKRSTGLSPFQWLLRRRIERAQELLADSRLSLAEVALAVGFSAQPQFTTAFRRVTGTTPGAWRRERLL